MLVKVVLCPAVSLDGFIAKSDGNSDWVTDEDEQLFADEVRKAGCVIVGSTTFNQYDGTIYPIKGATTFVCTSRPDAEKKPIHNDLRFIGGNVKGIIRSIQVEGFMTAVLSGGGDTNGRFAQAGAIDEIHMSIYPHFLGEGLPVFGSRQVHLDLELLNTQTLGSGVVRNRYKVLKP